jgi:hypothetical protein
MIKMVMSFENVKALNFLLDKGFVYTFRTHKHKLGKDWINAKRGLPKIADVNITFIKDANNLRDLEPYVKSSGFKDVIEWNEAIMELNPKLAFKNVKGYLYRVSLRHIPEGVL